MSARGQAIFPKKRRGPDEVLGGERERFDGPAVHEHLYGRPMGLAVPGDGLAVDGEAEAGEGKREFILEPDIERTPFDGEMAFEPDFEGDGGDRRGKDLDLFVGDAAAVCPDLGQGLLEREFIGLPERLKS